MPRDPYRPVDRYELLRPVASPVDTFVRAQEPSRDTNLQDLARSLSGLGGSLAGLVGQRDKEAEEADAIRGEAAFHTNNQQGYAEAVASGVVPAQASQSFMRAYKKAEGEVAGGVLEQKFAAAYDTWDGKTSTDPKVYDAFVSKFLKESISTQDPDVLRGLLPKIRQVTSNYLQRHIGDVSRSTMEGAVKAGAAKNDQVIEQANSAGLSSRKGTDYGAVFGQLEANRAESLRSGVNAEKYDKELVDGVTSSAIKLRDPKILDFLDRKVPGQDYTWGNTPYGKEQRQKTIDALETMGRRSIAEDEKTRREEKAAAKDDITRRTIGAITADPKAPIPEDLLSAGEKVDPDFRVNAIRWRDTIAKGGQVSDNEEVLGVTRDILNGGGVQVVQKAMERGVFKNAEDLTKAYKLAESMSKDGPALEGIIKSGSAKTILDTIKQRTATDKDASKFFDDGSVSPEGLQAQQDFKLQILAWRQANPNANAIEQEKAIGDIGAGILKRIQQPEVMGPVGYDREGIGSPNTYGASGAPKAMPPEAGGGAGAPVVPKVNPFGSSPAPAMPETDAMGNPVSGPGPAAPVPAPAAPPANPADAGSWFNGLGPDVKSAIELKAAQEKKPLSLKVQELYQRGVERGVIQAPAAQPAAPGKQSMRAPDGTPIETAALGGVAASVSQAIEQGVDQPPPPETVQLIQQAFERALGGSAKPVGNYSLAVLKDDPKAARILDFVAGPESGGNYNAYYGNGNSTRDLSQMTLDQVASWSGNRGTKSSATGRYQFMKATLIGETRKGKFYPGLKQEMGLSGSERFTPELQDRMAMHLLNRRGYSKWARGEISATQFANNLALEWASLPNITAQNGRPAGVSAYAGDGLNKSLVRPSAVLAALGSPSAPTSQVAQAPAKPTLWQRLFGRRMAPKPPAEPGTRV